MDLKTVVVRTQDMMSAEVDDEIVILNLAKDNYIGLDAIGRRIWELLETPSRVEALCRQLVSEFEATGDQIAADVLSFLEDLETERLLQVVTESPA